MNKGQLIQFLRQNEIWAKRTMGQNFLVDDKVLAKIVAAAELKSSDTVVEIGPGLGVLTEELAKRAGKVIAIEKDEKLCNLLIQKLKGKVSPYKITNLSKLQNYEITNVKNVEILNQDAFDFEANSLKLEANSYKVVANIPYNITSLIIRKFLEEEHQPELMVLMVQKEVAERITAKPGEMSLLSVAVQFYADAEIVDIVKNSSFFPVPKVDSAIIRLKIKDVKLKIKEKEFFRIVKFGFVARRKTLENNLAAGLHISKPQASDIIKKAGLGEKIRAQDLAVEDWLELNKIVCSEGK